MYSPNYNLLKEENKKKQYKSVDLTSIRRVENFLKDFQI